MNNYLNDKSRASPFFAEAQLHALPAPHSPGHFSSGLFCYDSSHSIRSQGPGFGRVHETNGHEESWKYEAFLF